MPVSNLDSGLIKVTEATEFLQVSRWKLYEMMKSGSLYPRRRRGDLSYGMTSFGSYRYGMGNE